jgi:alkylation response protein AidB-like acyl-CoA dehydrogenase
MAMGLTDEHRQLSEAIRDWAKRSCPPEAVRAAAEAPDGGAATYRDSIRPALARLGTLGLHLPENAGGQGYGLAELAVATAELGRALVPGGFLPTVLASAVLDAAGGDARQVARLADGSAGGAVCLAAGLTGAAQADGGLLVDGEAGPVLGGTAAELVIAPVSGDVLGEAWVLLDAADLHIEPLDSLDLTRPAARIQATGLTVPASRRLTGLDRTTVTDLAAILFGAEASGIADWAVETAAEYARIRRQFGRPIGQFQAVKHRCAWMLTAAERGAATAWDAARARDENAARDRHAGAGNGGEADAAAADGRRPHDEAEFAAAACGLTALDAAVSCVHECIQVLGGIGYTWEHPAHLYYRRAMSLRAMLGPSGSWARRMAGLAMAGTRRSVRVELGEDAAGLREEIRAELARIAALDGRERAEALAAGGWVVPHLPRPWGRAAGALEQVVIDQELRAAGIRPPALLIGAWVVPALIAYGTAEQQRRFIPPTLRGEVLWCQLFSEPGAGSDLAGLSTKAVRTDGGWRLTGQKIWTSLAREAAWAICVARTDPAAPRHDGISYFLVDMRSPGVEVRPLREMTGESAFNQVFLDDVFVPDECLVGEVNGGWKVARTTLANERVSLSRSWTFGCGVPELLDVARAVPAEDRIAAERLGTLVADGHAIDVLGLRATVKQLSGTEPGATGSVRKLLGMRHAQLVAEACWEMTGTSGALGPKAPLSARNGPDGRHWARQVLMTRALTIGGGTTDIQLNIIGERILSLPRDPEPPEYPGEAP